MRRVRHISVPFFILFLTMTNAMELQKEHVDQVIEDEITEKLSEDLLQSIERKFQVDLEKSVDMVMVKIKFLLQNGTMHIQDKLEQLQGVMEVMKTHSATEVEQCLNERQNDTIALAEKALHQMVVCGYALIGHDPSQAVSTVMTLKNMIKEGMKPIRNQKEEVHRLLKACGHNHDTLKKVIKCVIAKSPIVKAAMMEVTGKLIEGVVDLTKQMAHGAMHEACLIEVVKTIEDEASDLISKVRNCAYSNSSYVQEEINKYIGENNATVLNIENNNRVREENVTNDTSDEPLKVPNTKEVIEMKDLIRRMLTSEKREDLDTKFKKKLLKLQKDLGKIDDNDITNDVKNRDK